MMFITEDKEKVEAFLTDVLEASESSIMTTSTNVFLLTAAVALVGLGVTTITTNLLTGSVEFILGVISFYLYEKFPSSPTS